jgi:Mycoplasma protein of unknown function, DUF285
MFEGATSFNRDLLEWGTVFEVITPGGVVRASMLQNVVTMEKMFKGATSYNGRMDTWDVTSVVNFVEMFSGATSFNQPLDQWARPALFQVTTMQSMFEGATSFNRDLLEWGTRFDIVTPGGGVRASMLQNVVTMEKMFKGATSFNGRINTWDVTRVVNFFEMFFEAKSFNQPLDAWTPRTGEIMIRMFGTGENEANPNDRTNFNQNLCPWNGIVRRDVRVDAMVLGTNCPEQVVIIDQTPPIVDGRWCRLCV